MSQDAVQARITSKGIKACDIKHCGRLTDDQIASISLENIYAWVKTGQWSNKDFQKWLKVLRVIE